MANKILKLENTAEIVEKKSRFICYLRPVHSQEEAEDFVKEIKKKHYDARHNCYAYIIGKEGEIFHSSDDGEPSGTAGRPMLEVLEKEGLYDVAAVVTRYFGGVLLGTGGLVRAYQGATKEAIETADIVSMVSGREFNLQVDYNTWGKVEHFFRDLGVIVSNVEYGAFVDVAGVVTGGLDGQVTDKIVELTAGACSPDWGELVMVEVK